MKLQTFVARLRETALHEPHISDTAKLEQLREMRELLTVGLLDQEFIVDCIVHDLHAWYRWELLNFRGVRPAMVRIADRGIQLRMFFWAPGQVAPPHEHTRWTLSAVFHNQLNVTTYDWDHAVQKRALQQRNEFTALRGQAGYVSNPCIHSPRNLSQDWSTSLHVFNEADQPVLERTVGPIAGLPEAASLMLPSPLPVEPLAFREARDHALHAHALVVRQCTAPQAASALRAIQHLTRALPT